METIKQIMVEEFGVTILSADPVTVLWAAGHAADQIGVEAAKRELSEVNETRNRHGKVTLYPAWGDRLF